ncbi:MAG TPA: BTAD domain-containing putative transcriptional regulator [Streptosporangiaceae bacterium]|jgi:DNA-binding SARP family transcriptional activator
MEQLSFRVLGHVEVMRGGKPVALSGRYSVNLLAGLLLSANQPVGYDRLAAIVWGDSLPASPAGALQSLMSRLRRGLGGDTIQTLSTGYRVSVAGDALDLLRFEQLIAVAQAALAGDSPDRALAAIDQALDLWNLPVLANVQSDILLRDGVSFLTERYLSAQEKRAELRLKLGHYRAMIAELKGLVSAHPFREVLVGLLMLALYRSHRQAEALVAYRGLQQSLREGLGLDPSQPLQRLHLSILQRDASLDDPDAASALTAADGVTAAPGPASRVPRQLPPDIGDFTGRVTELARILRAAGDAAGPRAVVLAGPGGIGKTALAVRAGHQLAAACADGQVYLDAQAGGTATDPADLIARIIAAFGVSERLIPGGLPERASMYRSLVADKRFLLILDNVRGEAQIRDLLPAGPGCAVIVTARPRLAGLPGAQLIELGDLDDASAAGLLGNIISAARVSREPRSAAELIRLCGGLPLALRIAGARLAAKPHWQLATLVQRLADERLCLDELTYGDLDVRATISASYARVSPGAQAMLRKLAMVEAPDIPLRASRALLDTSPADAEELCERLVDAQLLDASAGSAGPHYLVPELVRVYAREQAARHDAAARRTAGHCVSRC